ncbi:MAG: sulfatase-like hydrolase/transferase, partial [Planctomycetaceae bacterium]|nr:sulfatase-like hydrolase/transferase [Planctomycetaceae bacterium]
EVVPWEEAEAHDWQDRRMAVYAAMVEIMDRGIGRILETLKAEKIDQNTVVMFLSDNGGCREIPGGEDPAFKPGVVETYTTVGPSWAYASNTPFRRYKQWVHEGGISTPFIVHWPGKIEGGTFNRNVGHIIDLLPTCAELGGATYPEIYQGEKIEPVEGLSLLSVMKSGEKEPALNQRTLYWEWAGNRAIRMGDWKLCWDRDIKAWELYHITEDRTELHDLAAQRPDQVEQMSQAWFAWAKRTGLNVKN